MTTIVRKNTLNTANFTNLNEPKVIKQYDDTPKENIADAMGKTVEELKPQHAVTFEKAPQFLPGEFNTSSAPVETPAPTATENEPEDNPNLTPEQQRAERRAAFKRAADVEKRAIQMQKQAQEQMAQLKQFQNFMAQAKQDPTAVAKALGMDPTDFLRQYQNQMFNIPNEPEKPAPEEDIKTRLARYEEERRKEKEELQQYKSQQIRNDYIQSRIIPVITADTEKFELLNMNGRDQVAGFIYDMMDAHFRSTGEELNPLDVAEEMENQLTKEFEEKLQATRKLKKFGKHFRTDTDAPGQEITVPGQLEVRTSTQDNQQLGAELDNSPNTTSLPVSQGLPTKRPLANVAQPSPASLMGADAMANAGQRQHNYYNKKESRIKRIEESLRAGVLPPSRNR